MAHLLHSQGLEIHDVPADGHCLYHAYARAVVHLINSGNKVNANIEDLTVEKLRRLVHNSASDFSLQHVGNDHESAAIIAAMIAEEGSSDEWGGLSAITILAKQHRVRVNVYDEIGNHIQQVQADEVSFPLLNIVRVNYTLPSISNTSIKAKSNRKNWSTDESFVAALHEWNNNPPRNSNGNPIPMKRFCRERCIPYRAFQYRTTRAGMSNEMKVAARTKNKEEKKKQRAGMSNEMKVSARTKDKEEKKKYRAGMSNEMKIAARTKNNEEVKKYRADMCNEMKVAAQTKHKEEVKKYRAGMSEEAKSAVRAKDRDGQKKRRADMSDEKKEAAKIKRKKQAKKRKYRISRRSTRIRQHSIS